MRCIIHLKVREWTASPQAIGVGMMRDQINQVVDKFTLAEAEGIWPTDQRTDAVLDHLEGDVDAVRSALLAAIDPEIERRVGSAASYDERDRVRCEIVAEMTNKGEIQKILATFL
ncbi:hypothetical protein Slin15195_G039270 [Septoria linicola]|uniref:Uncharacterized protein n=1 Tax=Septoria linicola TaxID=215465 RepID=A0A9Q9AR07_9PEZI|nr:hypothetical protein Slin14017_G120690 [Septoria linicola]USW50608.1 hypothetical protein Slin15195_G039270 [Septoria linicola]